MFTNAPVQDLLIRIKNAYLSRRLTVKKVIFSKMKEEVLKLLRQFGFISNYTVEEDGGKKYLIVHLHEVKDKVQDIPVIKFYSKPSRRWYVSYKDIKPVAWGMGIGIISTSKGLLPTHVAKKEKVGGELIAEIY